MCGIVRRKDVPLNICMILLLGCIVNLQSAYIRNELIHNISSNHIQAIAVINVYL